MLGFLLLIAITVTPLVLGITWVLVPTVGRIVMTTLAAILYVLLVAKYN